MGRRHNRPPGGAPPEPWELERTLAAAEEDQESGIAEAEQDVLCPCGSEEFLLQGYLRVARGRIAPEPVELETLTCPQCGREFEAVQTEDGRVLRGEFLGNVELDED